MIFYYIRRFWEIPNIEKRLTIKAFILSGLIRLMTQIIPLKFYFKILNSLPKKENLHIETYKSILIVRRTLKRIASISPWKCNCLIKVLTTKLLLNELGISSEVFFVFDNVTFESKMAHASLNVDNKYRFFVIPEHSELILKTYKI